MTKKLSITTLIIVLSLHSCIENQSKGDLLYEKAFGFYNSAKYENKPNLIDSSLIAANQAVKLLNNQNDVSKQIELLYLLSDLYKFKDEFITSKETLLKAEELTEKNAYKNKLIYLKILNKLGDIYTLLGDMDSTKIFYDKIRNTNKKFHQNSKFAHALADYGSAKHYYWNAMYDSAFHYYKNQP
jgi:tetratricopeptide (TPR) repeat protein